VTRESDPSGVGFGDKTTTFKKNFDATDELSAPMELVPSERAKNRELGVVLEVFHRAWPLAGLALALAATVGCITILDYVVLELL
jgi:hypothetical protein